LGLLIEEARTNSIRNSQAGGASAGTLPTNWVATPSINGLTQTIIGSGTEDGLTYLDIQYAGTPTASASIFIGGESTSEVVATNGQTWTSSFYVKLGAGSLSNTTIKLNIVGRQLGVGVVAGQVTATTITPTSAALKTQRASAARTMSSADVDRVVGQIEIEYTNANPIDLTLRIAAPQLEQGAFPTSYIPTTTAAATRAADSAVVTPISSFYNQAEGTVYNEFSVPVLDGATTLRGIAQFAEAAAVQNRLQTGVRGTGLYSFSAVAANSVEFDITTSAGAVAAGTTVRAAQVYKSGDSARSFNGAAVGTSSAAITQPTRERLRLGDNGSGILNGHIRKVAYWPKRLTNTLLEQLTT
jgi:hypothetical protein